MIPEWSKSMPGSRWKGNRFTGPDHLHLPGMIPTFRAGRVKKFLLAFVLLLAFIAAPASAWLAGYQNGTQFVLNTGTTLTNYQIGLRLSSRSGISTSSTFGGSNGGIAVLYTNGTTKADWSDIRFTDDSDNLLTYWLETGTQNATSAFVWVLLPSITSDGLTKVRFYYGNSGASSASNGFGTFNGYWDDFNTMTNWSVQGSGIWSVSNGNLTVNSTTYPGDPSRWWYLRYNTPAPSTSYNGELKYIYNKTNSQDIVMFEANNPMVYSPANQYSVVYPHPNPGANNVWVFDGWSVGGADYSAGPFTESLNTWYIGRFIRVSGANQAQVYAINRTSLAGPTTGTTDGGSTTHYYGFANSQGGDFTQWFVDWFFLRSYSPTEPTASTFTSLPAGTPGVSFTMNTSIGDRPLAVQFTDTSTSTPTSWFWEFGDDGGGPHTNTSTSQNPIWIYNVPGQYWVNLTASNSYGSSYKNYSFIIVNNPVSPSGPVAYAECENEQSTTSTTPVDACTLTFNAVSGDYVIATSFELGTNNPGVARAMANLTVNSAEKNSVRFINSNTAERRNFGWVRVETFSAGSQTIKVRYMASSNTVYIRNIHLLAWKAPTPQYAYTQSGTSITTTESTLQTLTFAPSVQQDYLILASAESMGLPGNNIEHQIRLLVDGQEKNTLRIYDSAYANIYGTALAYVANLNAASHTILLTGKVTNTPGPNVAARNRSIIAIPLSSLTTYKSSTETITSTTSTSYVDTLSYSPSLVNASNYIIFGSSKVNQNIGGWPGYNNLVIGGTQYQETKYYDNDGYGPYDNSSMFAVKRLFLDSGSRTFKIQHKTDNVGTTTYTNNSRILVIEEPKPWVVWNATPLIANLTTSVAFVDSSTGSNITAGGGNFNWSFNSDATDKNVSSLRNWTHTFPCTALPAADYCYYSVNHSVTDSPGTLFNVTSWLNQTNYIRVFQNSSPTVTFTAAPGAGVLPFMVTFTATPAGAIKVDSWSWNFGDTHTSTVQNPTNTYSGPGGFTVTLTAVNYTLGTATVTKTNWVRCS
jgi:PKD repeat protein